MKYYELLCNDNTTEVKQAQNIKEKVTQYIYTGKTAKKKM
jgi:hypothetical protein